LNGNVVVLSLGLVALVGASSRPVALGVWIESSISDHNSAVSHSDCLNNKENEAKNVGPEVAVVAVDDHGNNRDKSEDVKYKRKYEVGNKESRSSFACPYDTQRSEEGS